MCACVSVCTCACVHDTHQTTTQTRACARTNLKDTTAAGELIGKTVDHRIHARARGHKESVIVADVKELVVVITNEKVLVEALLGDVEGAVANAKDNMALWCVCRGGKGEVDSSAWGKGV